jgi:hypothetical protein
MLRGNKSDAEIRFELLTWGAVLVTAAALYVVFNTTLPSLMLFIPGLILLGSALYQDLQMGWKAGWLIYALAILAVATGLAGIVNSLLGEALKLPWLIVATVELGAILIAKALYDPNPHPQ